MPQQKENDKWREGKSARDRAKLRAELERIETICVLQSNALSHYSKLNKKMSGYLTDKGFEDAADRVTKADSEILKSVSSGIREKALTPLDQKLKERKKR